MHCPVKGRCHAPWVSFKISVLGEDGRPSTKISCCSITPSGRNILRATRHETVLWVVASLVGIPHTRWSHCLSKQQMRQCVTVTLTNKLRACDRLTIHRFPRQAWTEISCTNNIHVAMLLDTYIRDIFYEALKELIHDVIRFMWIFSWYSKYWNWNMNGQAG